ncbi:MAG: ROK family protein [Candidatus Saccharimonadales bacterium]
MYLGIDVGGTKTLVASLDDRGNITEKVRFPTDRDYPAFLEDLKHNIGKLKAGSFSHCAAGIPASVLDRSKGVGVRFGNLPWQDVSVRDDIADICGCPVYMENDAKLAGLSEALLLSGKYRSVMYVTVSTGIGLSLVVDGRIDTSFGDGGGRALLLEHVGKLEPWEDFASGRAIVKRYGHRAEDIDDPETWRQISRDLAQGLVQLIALAQPQVIVIGGGVGGHFDKYGDLLAEELKKYDLSPLPIPALKGAQHPEEAVLYGCYDLIKQAEAA